MCVSGSYEPPGQFVPPDAVPSVSVPRGPSALLATGGVNTGPKWYLETTALAFSRNCGLKSIKSSRDTPFRLYAAGFVGKGCVGEYHSPGTFPTSTFRSSIGHTGLPVMRSKT